MKKTSKIIAVVLSAFLTLGMCACNNNIAEEIDYKGDVVHFSTSDAGFTNFLNDFTRRNLRFDEMSVADELSGLGNGTGFAKNWETMGLVWHNSRGKVLGEDKIERLKWFMTTIDQDDYGMVYNSHNTNMPAMSNDGDGISQGWPFPTARNSERNAVAFEFNYDSERKNWDCSDGGKITISGDGYMRFSYSAFKAGDSLRIIDTSFSNLTASGKGMNTKHAPIVEMELAFTDMDSCIGKPSNVEDISVIWQTEEGGDEWFKAPRSLYATKADEITYSFSDRMFFSMYLHPDWNEKSVKSIGIEITAKDGAKLRLNGGKLNYIRPGYDTRQSNSSYQFILALSNFISSTNDSEYLELLLPKARKAFMFLSDTLEGSKGLVDISYFYGHNGIGATIENGVKVDSLGDGLGNGYWDILTAPEKNLEANLYYYQAICKMIDLENYATDAGINKKDVEIKNRVPGESKVKYNYTVESLTALKNTVKENISKTVSPVKEGDKYVNNGGFWNPETKRFASGIRSDNGAIIDYGFVYWNEEAVAAGLGTDEQRKDIMQWINGDRKVDGDLSSGDDMYFYEFAPRFSTVPNFIDYGFFFSSPGFSKQVQDGGAIICWSYYDLVSRINVLGKNNAFDRFKGIEEWYNDVLSIGGTGTNFYNDYYMFKEDGSGYYILQQTNAQAGAMGLDTEFKESIMLTASVPYGFFGMDGSKYNTLSFTNNLPDRLKWWQIDNMCYDDLKFSVRMERNSLEIKNLSGTASGQKIQLSLPYTKGSVYIDGTKTEDYTKDGSMITVEVPFANVKVEVR